MPPRTPPGRTPGRTVRTELPKPVRRPPARRPRRIGLAPNSKPRLVIGRFVMIAALVLAGIRLIDVQGFQAPQLSEQAQRQALDTQPILPTRGIISDRNGTELAFNVDIRALSARPKASRNVWNDPKNAKSHQGRTYDQHAADIAAYMAKVLGSAVNEQTLTTQLQSDVSFVYLDKQVDPALAQQIVSQFPTDITAEVRSMREYPDGTVAANIIGLANWRTDQTPNAVHGVTGLEAAMDGVLGGKPGEQQLDTQRGNANVVIPGSLHVVTPATPGENVQLTIDADLQYEVQQKLNQYVVNAGAKWGSAVVLDAHTGEVYALANDTTFNPNDPSTMTPTNVGDIAVTNAFEPGSVNKIVTAAAAIEAGLVTPDSVIDVPSTFQNGDKVVTDDWSHGDWKMTVAGVFAKSSNIGADELAKLVGKQSYDQMLYKMGLGQKTGIELPGESSGYVPPMDKWSGSTFGNLPIGQGLSMTILQMAGMYQAMANDGVRVPPRIIKSVTNPDGTVVPTQQPAGIRVVSSQTAQTVRMMMRAVTQKAKSPNEGTAPSAALAGYQVTGKTGTAQVIDPTCGCYSTDHNRVTFAGILSADNPRFVVGIMLEQPNGDVEGGKTAAPLFHDIASYLAQRYQLPVSPTPTPYYTLVEPTG